jgi:hypothetical protein
MDIFNNQLLILKEGTKMQSGEQRKIVVGKRDRVREKQRETKVEIEEQIVSNRERLRERERESA